MRGFLGVLKLDFFLLRRYFLSEVIGVNKKIGGYSFASLGQKNDLKEVVIPGLMYGREAMFILDHSGHHTTLTTTSEFFKTCPYCTIDICFFDCETSRSKADDGGEKRNVFSRIKSNGFISGCRAFLSNSGIARCNTTTSKTIFTEIMTKTLEAGYRAFFVGEPPPEYPVLQPDRGFSMLGVDTNSIATKRDIIIELDTCVGFVITHGKNKDSNPGSFYAVAKNIYETCAWCGSATCEGDCRPLARNELESLRFRLAYNAAIDALLIFTVYWLRAGLLIDETYIAELKKAYAPLRERLSIMED